MAMAVAENPVMTPTQSRPRDLNLGLASLAGGVILLLGFGLVFGALPVFWSEVLPTQDLNEFLSGALLLIAGITAVVAVCLAWYKLDQTFSAPGLRAGSFVAAAALFISAWIVFGIGNATDQAGQEGVGIFVTLLVAGLFLAGIVFAFTRAAFGRWLISLDENGWFTNQSFKGNQGVRVRRATVLGLLVIGITGIITLVWHGSFGGSRAGNDWYWRVPYSSDGEVYRYIPLLFKFNILGPFLLGALVFWFSWRLVNWPTFADFLIATEAEINKVSWTTRKRLFADTIVVLVTVFFMTAFLFGVDILWFNILQSPFVDVLHVDLKREQAKQQEKTQW
jgi:preprotein translocase SecE subunit